MLDLSDMRTLFDAHFKEEVRVEHWFSTLLHSSTVCALTGIETTFAALAKISLARLVAVHNSPPKLERRQFRGAVERESPGEQEGEQFIETALKTMASLRAHGDIVPALTLLKDSGFKTVAFSNSSFSLINQQVSNAGLTDHFDEIISVEGIKNFKPHAKVYHYAASCLNEPIETLTLVAAHDWDTHGAMNAGMKAAYLKRNAAPYSPLYQQPEITGDTMIEVAKQLIAKKV